MFKSHLLISLQMGFKGNEIAIISFIKPDILGQDISNMIFHSITRNYCRVTSLFIAFSVVHLLNVAEY